MASSPFRVRMIRLTALLEGTALRSDGGAALHAESHPTEWYVVETKLHKERLAVMELGRKVPVVLLPLRRFTEIACGRRRYREVPLFPSHVFVGVSRGQSMADVKYVPGVSDSVSTGGQMVPVPPEFVAWLRQLVGAPEAMQPGTPKAASAGEFFADLTFNSYGNLFRGDASDRERMAVLFGALRSGSAANLTPG